VAVGADDAKSLNILETSPTVMVHYGDAIHLLDKAILAVFGIEIALRLYVHRLPFFRDPWSVFDFLVVGIALLPATGQFSVLRALRVLLLIYYVFAVIATNLFATASRTGSASSAVRSTRCFRS